MTHAVKVRSLTVGGGAPVSIQTMANADPHNFDACLAQLKAFEAAGADLVRFTLPDMEALPVLARLREVSEIPLVADIHFNHRLAVEAAYAGIDKIRINPGNIGSADRVREVADACRLNRVPIRIGVNAGSLEKGLLAKYGSPTPEALVESGLSEAEALERFDFHDIVISIKTSRTADMIKACRLMHEKSDYPLHLGVTEAGGGSMALVKSAIGIGTLLSLIGIGLVRCKEGASQKQLLRSLLTGTLGSSIMILFALLVLIRMDFITWGIFGSVISGLLAGVIIGQATEYYTSSEYGPTKGISSQAQMGPATTIIDGLATGMYSSGVPVVTIVIGILCAFGFAGGFSGVDGAFSMGLYGVGFAAVGMLSTLGITLATDAYGPIADNAGGNAEMSGLPSEVRGRTDALDSLGNTTAATGKGFAIGSAALTALALLASFIEECKIWIARLDSSVNVADIARKSILDFVAEYQITAINPLLIGGLFIGSMAAFLFCAMTMKAVGRAAGKMVEEVRRQFQAMPGIMEGKEKPDYARCVAISTAGAQKEMLVPSLLAILIPVLTGLILGLPGVMGLLAGGLASGFVLATMLNNAGGAWDNAKKYIENGAHGGKKLADGSKNPTHGAAVIGDTVGDPCKDTSGPALNILIKLMSMVCIVFAPVFIKFGPVVQSWLGIDGLLK